MTPWRFRESTNTWRKIIVDAQAHGTGSEQELLLPVVEAMHGMLAPTSLVTADAGYHSAANLQQLATRGIDALIADPAMRTRDARFATQALHAGPPRRPSTQALHHAAPDPLHDKSGGTTTAAVYQPDDFTYDAVARTCVWPAGKTLYRKGRDLVINGFVAEAFHVAQRDCGPCARRAQCLRTPGTTPVRNVAFFRGRTKVDAQWKLYCLVHNIEKLAQAVYAA